MPEIFPADAGYQTRYVIATDATHRRRYRFSPQVMPGRRKSTPYFSWNSAENVTPVRRTRQAGARADMPSRLILTPRVAMPRFMRLSAESHEITGRLLYSCRLRHLSPGRATASLLAIIWSLPRANCCADADIEAPYKLFSRDSQMPPRRRVFGRESRYDDLRAARSAPRRRLIDVICRIRFQSASRCARRAAAQAMSPPLRYDARMMTIRDKAAMKPLRRMMSEMLASQDITRRARCRRPRQRREAAYRATARAGRASRRCHARRAVRLPFSKMQNATPPLMLTISGRR